ncbi:hypothetical protein ACFL2Q_00875 [Thermodesulfobacteriota bacterium]
MEPKTLTRLLAAAGLGGIAAVHWLPKHFLPFGSRVATSVLIAGVLLVAHRHPLKAVGKDTAKALGVNSASSNALGHDRTSHGAAVRTT